MGMSCAACGNSIELAPGTTVGRTETCDKCGEDLHSCRNCEFYDQDAYNECREPQAERVVDKERSNFCDYFSLGSGSSRDSAQTNKKKKALEDLDDLFK